MNFREYLKTWEGTQAENRFNRYCIVGLIALSTLLTIKAFTKDTIVTMQPVTLVEEAWVTQNKSSQSYQEAWGLYLAQVLGNVTPATVTFLKERLGPLLSPDIFPEVMEVI